MTIHSNFVNLGSMAIPAGALRTAEFETTNYSEFQLYPTVVYSATASGLSGLSASATDGVGNNIFAGQNAFFNGVNTPTPIYYDSVGSVVAINPVLLGQSATSTTKINVPLSTMGNWYKLTMKNNDLTNACTVTFYGDAS